jgi:hypothetical protein
VKNKVSHSYKITGKIILLYILILKDLEGRCEEEILNRMVASFPKI